MVEFNDFARFLIDFPLFFKAGLIFNVFLVRPLNSSTFQACANPDVACRLFFKTNFFQKFLLVTLSEYQTVYIQIRTIF